MNVMSTHVLDPHPALVAAPSAPTTRSRAAILGPLGWLLIVLTVVGILSAGALLTLSVLETSEYDRDAFSIVD